MKIVLDTNVLVSGLLSPFGAPGEIVRMVAAGTLQLCLDARIISEYRMVLQRPKFQFNKDQIGLLLDHIEACGLTVASTPLSRRLPDKDDESFMEAAVAGKAEYLVTGNLSHYPSECRQGIQVVTPNVFLDEYRKTV